MYTGVVTVVVTVMALTDRGIRNLRPEAKDKFIADDDGLYLRVYPSGTKSFVYRSRDGGRARWIKLGDYPALGLAAARALAQEMSLRLPEHLTTNCRACYDAWMKGVRKGYVRPEQVTEQLERYFLPKFESRTLHLITTAELSRFFAEIAETAPVAANRLLGVVKPMFNFAVQRGWIKESPAAPITRKVVGGKEKSRDRVLTDDELTRFISVLRSERFDPPTRLALAIALCTGQRTGEVRGVTSAEVLDRVWRIPAQRTKNGIAQAVILHASGYRLLSWAFNELGTAPFASMDRCCLSRAVARMKFDPPFTPHDLRRTMATRMAELGVAPHVVEKCLNHKMGGVMEIYNRAEYAAEKSAAWRLWHRHLLKLAKKNPR